MTDKNDWQGRVGASWASEWSRTDRSFSALTDRLLGLASSGGFKQALDVGCGAGEISLALGRGHPSANIYGIDISDKLISAARHRGKKRLNVTFEQADATSWTPPADVSAPDLIVSRHGVMFFDHPTEAFSHLRRIAAPGARLAFSCFRGVSDNAWASQLSAIVPGDTPTPPSGPGPFAFADDDKTRRILEQAGWQDLSFEAYDYPYIAGTGEDPVEDAHSFFLTIGPAARAAAQLEPDQREKFSTELRGLLERYRDGGMVMMKAGAWLVTGRASA